MIRNLIILLKYRKRNLNFVIAKVNAIKVTANAKKLRNFAVNFANVKIEMIVRIDPDIF